MGQSIFASYSGFYAQAYGERPVEERLFRTQSLGDLIITQMDDHRRAVRTYTFRHKGLDLIVERCVAHSLLAHTRYVDFEARCGYEAEEQMLQMLRDKINPPPKPAPAPTYTIQLSGFGAAPYYLRRVFGGQRSWAWEHDVADATPFNSPKAAVGFLTECAAKHGGAFTGSVTVVRVDIQTQTVEKRTVTVLK